MKKLLIIGDFHIPQRTEKIPSWIIQLTKKNKFDLVLCTGDLVYAQVLDFLKKIAPLKVVQGNMDFLSLPEQEIVEIEGKRIGLIHGKGIHPRGNLDQLYSIAKKLNVTIFVHGHTHKLSVEKKDGILFLNPGSATGCWGGSANSSKETLIILELDKNKLKIRKFQEGKEIK